MVKFAGFGPMWAVGEVCVLVFSFFVISFFFIY